MSIAIAEFQSLARAYPIVGVHTIDETRRARLGILIERYGSIAELNIRLDLARTDATLSQVRNQSAHSKTGMPRTMGDALARKIEEKLGLERGWMDTPPTYAELHGEDDPKAKVMLLMEQIPQEDWPKAVRLLGALAEPAPLNGTNH